MIWLVVWWTSLPKASTTFSRFRGDGVEILKEDDNVPSGSVLIKYTLKYERGDITILVRDNETRKCTSEENSLGIGRFTNSFLCYL